MLFVKPALRLPDALRAQVMESLAQVDAVRVDWCLLEYVAGTPRQKRHGRSAAAASAMLVAAHAASCIAALELQARGALAAMFPLVVGAECTAADGRPARDRLFNNARFRELRAALPALVPTATLAHADALLRTRTARRFAHP